jgi:hypothetical protein
MVERPPARELTVMLRKLSQIENCRFRQDLQSMCDEIIQQSGKELAERYDQSLSAVLDNHAPLKTKTIRVKTRVAWFDDTAKALKTELRKIEKIWKRTKKPSDMTKLKTAKILYRKHLSCPERKPDISRILHNVNE